MIRPTALTTLLASDAFSPLDRHFADLIRRLSGSDQPALTLAAALVSRRLADGHPCLSLDEVAGQSLVQSSAAPVVCPPRAEWEATLLASPVAGRPGKTRPLILDTAGRLYLHRYWTYEQTVAEQIRRRVVGQASRLSPTSSQKLGAPASGPAYCELPDGSSRAGGRRSGLSAPAKGPSPTDAGDRRDACPTLDAESLRSCLDRLFPADASGQPSGQKVAAFMAARQRFCVITGGPGTGKTWTVARLLALLLEQPGAANLRVRLAAPTGKAVARLQESLASALAGLDCPDAVKTRLQAKDLTTTLHRLLGTIPNSVKFRHNADHPLPVDVLVVDETSMVSLPLMARLLAALPPAARLILVGDKDQLSPVDPGNVLGDLCQAAAINGFSETFRADYERCGGEALPVATEAGTSGTLLDCVVQLGKNYRSGETAALHAVSAAVNAGDATRAGDLLREFTAASGAVAWQPLPAPGQLEDALRTTVISHYGPVLQAASATEALRALGRFRILCAVREGPYGTIAVNRLVEQILGEEGFTTPEAIQRGSYAGKPLMVTANHYLLKLYNGDTGVVGQPPPAAAVPATALVVATNGGGSSLVHFPEETGGLRAIARERLPEHETAYALTIHKSQGSEFEQVLLILPDATSPVLTRALLYTGLTRAKKVVRLLASEASLRAAIESPAPRRSGLSDALARPTA